MISFFILTVNILIFPIKKILQPVFGEQRGMRAQVPIDPAGDVRVRHQLSFSRYSVCNPHSGKSCQSFEARHPGQACVNVRDR